MNIHRKNILKIFQGLEAGLNQQGLDALELKIPSLEEIDPELFNRAKVVIEGEEYTLSIFRPAKTMTSDYDEG